MQTTGVFLQILQNFQEHFFYRTPRVATSEKLKAAVVFCKKGVLRNSAKFTGKQLRQSLFVTALGLQLY